MLSLNLQTEIFAANLVEITTSINNNEYGLAKLINELNGKKGTVLFTTQRLCLWHSFRR